MVITMEVLVVVKMVVQAGDKIAAMVEIGTLDIPILIHLVVNPIIITIIIIITMAEVLYHPIFNTESTIHTIHRSFMGTMEVLVNKVTSFLDNETR